MKLGKVNEHPYGTFWSQCISTTNFLIPFVASIKKIFKILIIGKHVSTRKQEIKI